MGSTLRSVFHIVIILILASAIGAAAVILFTSPSNNRTWVQEQTLLPRITKKGTSFFIENVRNFAWTSTSTYVAAYYNKSYDVSKLVGAWYIVVPFEGVPGSAHTFVSFEFENDEFVAISVEARREKTETYSPVAGLFNKYELLYVIADEKDLLRLRANFKKDPVYVYPLKASKESAAKLFESMLGRAHKLESKPEFYNTLTNACTNNIAKHVREIAPDALPYWDWRIVFPKYSDEMALEQNLIDTTLPLLQAREKFLINNKSETFAGDSDYSRKIRE